MPFKYYHLILISSLFILISACVDLNNINEVELFYQDAEYAIPLVNSKLTLETAINESNGNARVTYDENNLATIRYSADVVKKQAYDVFKPIVFPGPLPFTDSVEYINFDQIDNYVVERGTIRGDSIRFGFSSPFSEEITIEIGIRELNKNGQAFKKNISISPGETFVTPLYSIKGYDFESPNNYLSFYYDARNSNGDRVLLQNGYFEFTYFVFDFVQGFLGKNTQKLKDHQIQVNVFDMWQSGLLEFDDPKIKVRLDNSFGFPVKAIINQFDITNLSGITIPLESTIFNADIFFDYPSLDEIGEIKSSEFVFDKNNSNFATAFNQKVTKVSYDVDAQANPANDPSLIGFFTFDSYYLLNVAVELPMRFKAVDFQLADTFPIDSIPLDIDFVEEVELKIFLSNLFPVDSWVQLYVFDENDNLIDSLFTESERYFPAATVNSDGSIIPAAGYDEPLYIYYGEERKDIFKKIRKIAPRIRFSTQDSPEEWTSITKDQGLDVKIGAKFKLK